jgi:hypothetical protein
LTRRFQGRVPGVRGARTAAHAGPGSRRPAADAGAELEQLSRPRCRRRSSSRAGAGCVAMPRCCASTPRPIPKPPIVSSAPSR